MVKHRPDGGFGALVLLFLVLTSFVSVHSEEDEDIAGNWSPWSVLKTPCSKSCGGGLRNESRSCTNPYPSGNGVECRKTNSTTELLDFETRLVDCNTQSCYLDSWTNWTECRECENHISFREQWCETYICNGADLTPYRRENRTCNGWILNDCLDPCELDEKNVLCPDLGKCVDTSTTSAPSFKCECTMGFILAVEGGQEGGKMTCIRPMPPDPTPKPIPTLPPEQKVVANVISKTASTVLIIFVSITLALFCVMRVFSDDRVIQMNMEIALLMAHVCLIVPLDPSEPDNKIPCLIISIFIHFFFMACYAFIMLEALHMYSMVGFVVKGHGMFNRLQNTIIGWGLAAFIVLLCIAFELESYGGQYHCWLQLDTKLTFGNVVPIIIFSFVTITLIESAGSADYKPMKDIDGKQLLSAKISQRTNLIILPLVIGHWFVGVLSEYEQNLPLYGVFSVLNGLLGFLVFFFHTTNNNIVREKLKACFKASRR